MPIFDYYCEKCEYTEDDVYLKHAEDIVECPNCGAELKKRPPNFSFRLTPGAISKHKKRYGNRVPDEYKTSGGANIYGVPKKAE